MQETDAGRLHSTSFPKQKNTDKTSLWLIRRIGGGNVSNLLKPGVTVIPGFVIQGGDPNSKLDNRALHGTGGRAGKFFGLGDENDPNSWLIPAEFNDIPHTKGILSMARTNDPNSASSQFFVCHDNAPFLDKNYTVFGKVIEGQDVIDLIVNSEKDMNDNPIEKIEMTVIMKNKSEVIQD